MTFSKPTPLDLANFIGAGADTDDTELQTAIDLACAHLDEVLESAWREVPQVFYTQWSLELAHSYFKRGDALSGSTQYAFDGGQPIFEPKDVMNRLWPQVRRYVTPYPLPVEDE